MKKNVVFLFAIFMLGLLFQGCKKELAFNNSSSVELGFSTDTVLFDTVFTSLGSSTRQLKIFNPESEAIMLSSVRFQSGTSSKFRMNLDGVSGDVIEDIEILAQDSLFMFVDVTLDPNNSNTPMVVTDSLVFEFNGKEQYVALVAWGQDAFFYAPDPGNSFFVFDCNTTLTAEKPHVFYGYAAVDSLCELTIEAGAQLHFHGTGSGMLVYRGGSLKVQGDLDNEVVFQSDRLEPYYEDLPGQWGRIWLFPGSVDNVIEYAVIKNASIGLQVDTVGNGNPTLVLKNTVIQNSSGIGLFAQGSTIQAENVLVANSGQYDLVLSIGGDYSFKHCTFGNYWNFGIRSTPSVVVNNWYEDINGNIQVRNLSQAYFGNCVIFGKEESELILSEEEGADFNVFFEHCLIRSQDESVDFQDVSRFSNVLSNIGPKFVDPVAGDFRLDTLSPAMDQGLLTLGVEIPFDLKGDSRASDVAPDLGCYERVE